MEVEDRDLVVPDEDNCGPEGVNKHQEDRSQTSKSVKVKYDPASHFQHDSCPGCVKNQSCPEKY